MRCAFLVSSARVSKHMAACFDGSKVANLTSEQKNVMEFVYNCKLIKHIYRVEFCAPSTQNRRAYIPKQENARPFDQKSQMK